MGIGRFKGEVSTFILLTLALFSHIAGAQNTTEDSSSSTNPYTYAKFTPSMAIILAIFSLFVVLMAIFAIYVRHCSAAARGTVSPLNHLLPRAVARGDPGLSLSVLQSFPTFSYSEIKQHHIGKSTLECAVCLNEFAEPDSIKLLPICNHVFHRECIDVWLESHATCPVCRCNLAGASLDTTNQAQPEPNRETENVQEASEAGESTAENDRSRTNSSWVRSVSTKFQSQISILFFSPRYPPRSHSTGHCMVRPDLDLDLDQDRFTLRLPSEIRNQLLNRSASVAVPLPSERRKGFRSGGGSMDRIEENRWWSGFLNRSLTGNGMEGTSRFMGFVRQISVKRFGSRPDQSGSETDKPTRPAV